jgi:hypothetical protein
VATKPIELGFSADSPTPKTASAAGSIRPISLASASATIASSSSTPGSHSRW